MPFLKHNPITHMRLTVLANSKLNVAALLLSLTLALPIQAEEIVVFLVRHAEKESGKDPGLTPAGTLRAEELSRVLTDSRITLVYSSDYQRTRLTAALTVQHLGLELALYDASNLASLAKKIKSKPGRYLVVGHSNTTPAMVELLGGEPGTDISEDEYNRLYIVTSSDESDDVSTIQLRFGEP